MIKMRDDHLDEVGATRVQRISRCLELCLVKDNDEGPCTRWGRVFSCTSALHYPLAAGSSDYAEGCSPQPVPAAPAN